MNEYIINHAIEISGAIISLIYLYFSIKRLIWLWPFGLASAVFYIVIYLQSGFYADMGLQFYYVGISIYGWIVWRKGINHEHLPEDESGTQNSLKISCLTLRTGLVLLGLILLLWVLIWFILHQFTDSIIPGWDALTTAASIIATWMLARKILEHWLLWVLVDSISIGLYLWKELYPTVVLFVFYTTLAVVGYVHWKKEAKTV